jgi:ubiquinone/menaquinone biosynthesis C-methylase UbiE
MGDLTQQSSIGSVAIQIASKTPRKNSKLHSILKNLPAIQSSEKCLDIGTAHGGLAFYFTKIGNWSFVDNDPDNLDIARMILKGKFFSQDANSFLESNGDFSLITCFDTLMYFENTEEILNKFYRSLLINGRIAITGTEAKERNILIRIRSHYGLEKAHQFKVQLNAGVMRSKLESVGFDIETNSTFCGFFTELLQTILDYITSRKHLNQKGLVPNLTKIDDGGMPKLWQLNAINFFSLLCRGLDYLLPFSTKFGYLIIAKKSK